MGTGTAGGLALDEALSLLGARGITRVLAEGGGRLAAALLSAGLADRLVWFRAPGVIGAEGVPAIGDSGLARLADMARFRRTGVTELGEDLLETYVRLT